MEDKNRSTRKSFLSVDTADIIESSSTSESSEASDSDFENSIPRNFTQLAPISKPPPKSLPNFCCCLRQNWCILQSSSNDCLDDIEGKKANIIDKNKVAREKQNRESSTWTQIKMQTSLAYILSVEKIELY